MTYDDLGCGRLHISFEGVVKENAYDDFGRMSAMNYYADEAAYSAGLMTQRDEYVLMPTEVAAVGVATKPSRLLPWQLV